MYENVRNIFIYVKLMPPSNFIISCFGTEAVWDLRGPLLLINLMCSKLSKLTHKSFSKSGVTLAGVDWSLVTLFTFLTSFTIRS